MYHVAFQAHQSRILGLIFISHNWKLDACRDFKMTNEEERIQDILLFTQLMREDSECQSCRKTPMRLEEISNRLTRIETMLMHISNGQLLLPSSQSCTPRSVPSSGIDNFTSISSGAASASSTSPVKVSLY